MNFCLFISIDFSYWRNVLQRGVMSALFTFSEPAQIGIRTAFSLLVAVNLIGNSLVCLVVLRNRSMRNTMNYLLVNLACADMMVAIFIAPQYILLHTFKHPHGSSGDYLCKFITGGNLMWIGGVVSVVSLIAIAFERYFAVLYPHDDKLRITKTKLKLIIPACWLFSLLWNFPLFFVVRYSKELDFCHEVWPKGWYMNAYSLGWLIVIGLLPLSIMTCLYSRVVYNLWVRGEQPVEVTQQALIKSRRRVTKMVLTVTVVCAVCWLPNLIVYVLDFYGLMSHGGIVHTTTVVLVTLNSAVNPVIYCFQSKRFRICVKALLLSPCTLQRTALVEPTPCGRGQSRSNRTKKRSTHVMWNKFLWLHLKKGAKIQPCSQSLLLLEGPFEMMLAKMDYEIEYEMRHEFTKQEYFWGFQARNRSPNWAVSLEFFL